MPPSGHVLFWGPLSVEYMTMVLSAMPSSSSLSSIWPICSSWTTMRRCRGPARSCRGSSRRRGCGSASRSSCTRGRTADRPWPASRSTRARASVISSSMVSIRFLVSGPVSSISARPCRRGAMEHAARAELFLERGILGIVGELRLLLGVQVIEVAEELVEAVHGRQVLVAIAEVVLAELAGRVAERLEQLGDGRVLGLEAEVAPGMPTLVSPVRIGILPGDEARRGPPCSSAGRSSR